MAKNIYKKIEGKCEKYGVLPPKDGEKWEVSLEKVMTLISVLEEQIGNSKKQKSKGWANDE